MGCEIAASSIPLDRLLDGSVRPWSHNFGGVMPATIGWPGRPPRPPESTPWCSRAHCYGRVRITTLYGQTRSFPPDRHAPGAWGLATFARLCERTGPVKGYA